MNFSYLTPILRSTAKKHFKALDPDSIRSRFGTQLSQDAIAKYVDKATGTFFAVMLVKPNLTTCPVSVLHLTTYGDSTTELEIGISTLKHYQGKGYAKQLMMFAKGMAELSAIDSLHVTGVPDNTAMKELAKSVGFKVTQSFGEEFDGVAHTMHKVVKDMFLRR